MTTGTVESGSGCFLYIGDPRKYGAIVFSTAAADNHRSYHKPGLKPVRYRPCRIKHNAWLKLGIAGCRPQNTLSVQQAFITQTGVKCGGFRLFTVKIPRSKIVIGIVIVLACRYTFGNIARFNGLIRLRRLRVTVVIGTNQHIFGIRPCCSSRSVMYSL